jgi:hypothetical protein
MKSVRLSKQFGKIEVKSVLEEYIRSVGFTTGGCQRLLCIGIFIQSSKRQVIGKFCTYLLEIYIDADSKFPPPVWSECSASSLRAITSCELFHSHINTLFYSAHPNNFVVVPEIQNKNTE